MDPFDPKTALPYTCFFTKSTPGEICDKLESFLKANKNNYKQNDKNYSFKFEMTTEETFKTTDKTFVTEMKMKILKVDD